MYIQKIRGIFISPSIFISNDEEQKDTLHIVVPCVDRRGNSDCKLVKFRGLLW